MSGEPWQSWLRRARSNLARAQLGQETPDILYEDLCFDAQQAAEKALKGLLAYLSLDIPRTHSVGYLLKLIDESGRIRVPVRLEEAAILTDYAVTTRYPGDWDPIDETEYERALLLAQHVYEWVLSVMQQNPKM